MVLVLSTFCYFGSVAHTHTHTPNDYNQDSEEANQPSNQTTNQPGNQLTCLLCFRAVTTPQRWMIRPTYTVLLGGGAAPLFLF